MRNTVIYSSGAEGDSLGQDIAFFERMSETLMSEVMEGTVEQVTLVVRDVWDVVDIEKYAMLVRQLNALGVILEVFIQGRVNLATLDMFTAGLNRERDARARRTADERPGALRVSCDLQLTLEGMPQDWMPMSMASSLLYNLGADISQCNAEQVYDLYSKEAFCEVDIALVENDYLTRLGGSESRLLARAAKGWAVGPMPLGHDPMWRDNRIKVAG